MVRIMRASGPRRMQVHRREASDEAAFPDRALGRVRRGDKGRPGVLAWFAGLGIHAAVAFLLVL
jgi:hypothetical protein